MTGRLVFHGLAALAAIKRPAGLKAPVERLLHVREELRPEMGGRMRRRWCTLVREDR